MADKLRTLARLFGVYAKMDLMWFLRDTRYCLLYVTADLVCALASMAGVFLLSARLGGFGGLGQDELLFLLSYATTVDGVFNLFFIGNNTGNISRTIGRGQLDHCVIQPVPIWMQLLAGGFSPVSGSGKLLCGVVLTVLSLRRLSIGVGAWWILSFIFGVAASAGIVAAAVYILSSLAFIAPAAAEEIATTARAPFDMLKIYPLGGLPALWQAFFCSVVPVGLAAWLPSLALLGKLPFGPFPGGAVLAAGVFVAAASFIFRKGMRYYAKSGSPRYSGFGHR